MSVKIINCSSATLKNLVSSTRGLTFVASMVARDLVTAEINEDNTGAASK